MGKYAKNKGVRRKLMLNIVEKDCGDSIDFDLKLNKDITDEESCGVIEVLSEAMLHEEALSAIVATSHSRFLARLCGMNQDEEEAFALEMLRWIDERLEKHAAKKKMMTGGDGSGRTKIVS